MKLSKKIYFLAGPINEASEWQYRAVMCIIKNDPDSFIVCPIEIKKKHGLYKFVKSSDFNVTIPSMVLWQRNYMELAAKYGCIIFWLPEERYLTDSCVIDVHADVPRWSTLKSFTVKSKLGHVNMVIGAEKRFPGLKNMKENLCADYFGYEMFQIFDTLDETINAGIVVANTVC